MNEMRGILMLQADKDCKDFASQSQAQAWFEQHNDGLDADQDGKACEDFMYPAPTSTTGMTTTIVKSDATPTLPHTGSGTATMLIGALLLILVGLVLVWWRTRVS